jgi:hypothetical protein
MRLNSRSTLLAVVLAAAMVLGVFGTVLWSATAPRVAAVRLDRLGELTRLEPIRALPRTEMVLATMEARRYLEAGRPWAAWTVLEDHVKDPDIAGASAMLLAARAASEWGNWRQARDLLADQPWLERADAG